MILVLGLEGVEVYGLIGRGLGWGGKLLGFEGVEGGGEGEEMDGVVGGVVVGGDWEGSRGEGGRGKVGVVEIVKGVGEGGGRG